MKNTDKNRTPRGELAGDFTMITRLELRERVSVPWHGHGTGVAGARQAEAFDASDAISIRGGKLGAFVTYQRASGATTWKKFIPWANVRGADLEPEPAPQPIASVEGAALRADA